MHSPGLDADPAFSVPAPELPGLFTVSNNLLEALTTAARLLPPNRSTLTRADVLLAIAEGKGSGPNFIRYALTLTRGQNGNIYETRSLTELAASIRTWQSSIGFSEPAAGNLSLTNMKVPISTSLRDLLAISRQYASAQAIETGDVVAADAGSPGSILVPILNGWGAEAAGALLPRFAALDFSRRQEDYEDGAVPIVFEKAAGALPSDVAEAATDLPPRAIAAGQPRLRDLLAEDAEKQDRTVIRPDVADSLVGALEQSPFIILVTQRAYEAEAAIRDLASLVASDDKGVLGYKSIIEVESRALDANPYNALSSALSRATGGIAYIVRLHQYLDDANVAGLVQRAAADDSSKIVAWIPDTDWKTEQSKPIYRRARMVMPPAPKAEEIRLILLGWKTELESKISRDSSKWTITDAAVGELAKLAAKYPVDPMELIGNAAMGIRMSASPGLARLQKIAFRPDNQIDPVDVDLALTRMTGIVVTPDDPDRYLRMEEELKKQIIDQDQAIHVVSEAIITAMGGIKDPKRPTGAFIFMGPTGVGKSELARALAGFLFDDPNAVLRFDMSEYMEKHEVARLTGAPPGYVGYEEGGQLTEAVRRKPYSIVVFDEFEKAHPDVVNATLQILEEGKLTDGKGQVTDFSNTIVIFTGNVGAQSYQLIGQTDGEGKLITEERVKQSIREEIRRTFRPEFLNRIGDENADGVESNIVIFNTLKREDMLPILEIELKKMNKLLAENGLTVTVSDELKARLANEGYSQQYGARPLVRLVKRELGFPIAQKTLRGEFKPGDKLQAALSNGEVVIARTTPEAPKEIAPGTEAPEQQDQKS